MRNNDTNTNIQMYLSNLFNFIIITAMIIIHIIINLRKELITCHPLNATYPNLPLIFINI